MRVLAILLAGLALAACASAASKSEPRRPVEMSYLGNAGWQVTDGRVVILVDPYLSEFRKKPPPSR